MKSVARKLLIIFLVGLLYIPCYSQTIIQMEEYGGIFRIPCKVNGAKMKLVFDTGADKVCLSLSMADYLLDNDYISTEDIVGSGSTTVADGSIVDHIKINIRDIEIQGIHINNVEAIVIDGQNAPLLLGQSAIKKLGKYSISGNKLIVNRNTTSTQAKCEVDAENLLDEANEAKSNGYYRIAIEKYSILYNLDVLNPLDIMSYALCCERVEDYSTELFLLNEIQYEIEANYSNMKDVFFSSLGTCYEKKGDYDAALLNYEKAKRNTFPYSNYQVLIVCSMADVYEAQGNYYKSKKTLSAFITDYLNEKKIKATDCWNNNISNLESYDIQNIAYLFYRLSLANDTYNDEVKKYIIIAAAWGSEKAIEWCKAHNLHYKTKPNNYSYN